MTKPVEKYLTCGRSGRKETQGKKPDSSLRKRKSAAASSGREKIYVVRQESDREGSQISVTGTHSVKGKDERGFDITVVSSAPEKYLGKLESSVAMSPRRAARISTLMDRFYGTIKKAEKELAASYPTDSDQKKEGHLNVKEQKNRERKAQVKVQEQSKREREAQQKVNEQRKRERETLERMENTAKFGEDSEAVEELKIILNMKDQTKRERKAQVKEQRKREREALERMENTAQFQ